MSSKYDHIETAAELVQEVRAHGLSTAQEDICRAQDIFGNTSVEELARLANDIGRNNDQGEPDPKGSWSSSRIPTQGTFYMIAFSIWNWETATHFWNEHTNPQTETLRETKKLLAGKERQAKELTAKLEQALEDRNTAENAYNVLADKYQDASRRAEEAEAEVIRLKAKMYDYIAKEEHTA